MSTTDHDQNRPANRGATQPAHPHPDRILRFSAEVRFMLFWAGVITPVWCFIGAILIGPAWGPPVSVEQTAWALLRPPAAVPHFPLLMFNIGCLLLMVVAPALYAQSRLARYGIYSGVAYAAEYGVVLLVAIDPKDTSTLGDAFLALSIAAAVVTFVACLAWVFGRAAVSMRRQEPVLAFLPGLIALILTLLVIIPLVLLSLLLGPALALFAYGTMSLRLLRWRRAQGVRFNYSLAELCGLTVWWSVHLAVWRISFMLARGG